MAEVNPPLWMAGGSYTGPRDRELLEALWVRQGRVRSGDFTVTATGGMNIAISSGFAVVDGDHTASEGQYLCKNDASVSKVLAATNSQPRYDVVIAEVLNDTEYGDASDLWQIRVITGTPAASPAKPAIPNSAWEIATIAVPAQPASSVNAGMIGQNLEPRAYGHDAGMIVVETVGLRDAIPSPWNGMTVFCRDVQRVFFWGGAQWLTLPSDIPHTDVVKVVPGGTETIGATAAYANLPGSARLRRIGFTKHRGDSKVNVRIALAMGVYGGFALNTLWTFGVSGLGVDREVLRAWLKVQTSDDRYFLSGEEDVAGLAAGSYTVEVIAKVSTGTSGFFHTSDSLHLAVTETY